MNFDFSDDQKMLKEEARKFFSKSGLKSIRQVVDSDRDYDELLWRQIGSLGWLSTAIPNDYGGLELSYLELCVLAEEMGKVLAPIPFDSSLFMFAEAISLLGSKSQKQRFLPKVAQGAIIGTLSVDELSNPLTKDSNDIVLKKDKLIGKRTGVYQGSVADWAIITVRDKDSDTTKLVIVDLKDPSVSRSRINSINEAQPRATLVFNETNCEVLAPESDSVAPTRKILQRAAVLYAFMQLGGADACLHMAIEYAKTRYAFGRPIGSFQAIKHKLTDMYVKNELARSNAYYGAWALLTDAKELPIAAAAARVSATQAFDYAASENLQIHGGIGFTWESDCHLFYKRSKELGLLLGPTWMWKEELVKEVLRTK